MNNGMNNRKLKICFCASAGGHAEEILKLKPLAKKYDCVFFTEKSGFTDLSFAAKTYTVPQVNRKETLVIFKMVLITIKSLSLLLREKPNVLISSGALATIPICALAKLFNKRIVYIESLARVDKLSLTGRFMKGISNLYIVRSKNLLKFVPAAKYIGNLL